MMKTYAQLTREIQALQAHAQKLRAVELQAVIARLNETIAKHGLRAEDLRFAGSVSSSGASVRSSRQAAAGSSRAASSATSAKYGDGQGNSWGGRGPRPAWLRDALSKGRSLESFAISDTESNPAPANQSRSDVNEKVGNLRTGKANETSAVKSPLPPLYSHPKTGQTWSGRGPKPAWLKQGLKKRGASLNDFLISARESEGDRPEAAGAKGSASPSPAQASPKAKPVAAPRGAPASKKSLAEKISSRAKASSSATTAKPETAPAPAAASSAGTAKKAASKKAPAKKSSEASTAPGPAKTATKKSETSTASKPADAPPSATPPTPAKKTSSKTPAKTAAQRPNKPSAKKTTPANKRIASSMAPPADGPTSAAAPLPPQESIPTESPEAPPSV